MIPKYPNFAKIKILQKLEVDKYTSKFEPYSDFNFTSLLCWDINNTTEVSTLNGNLVIRLADYLTGKPVVSILGSNKIDQSLSDLVHVTPELKLVPEVVITNIKNKNVFKILEDRDNFDYVYSLENQALLKGGDFKGRRQKISRFKVRYPHYSVRELKLKEPNEVKIINAVFLKWAMERDLKHHEVVLESTAINNFLDNSSKLNLMCVIITVDNSPLGFSINELINRKYAVCHFQKSLLTHNDLDAVLTKHVAELLLDNGARFVNWEQDLGITGLRQFKESYLPTRYLKKYKLSKD